MRVLRKAEHIHVDIILPKTVPARAERQALAEQPDGYVVVAAAAVRGQRHLMGPLPVDGALAELAFAVDHAHNPQQLIAARALPRLAGGQGSVRGSWRAASQRW